MGQRSLFALGAPEVRGDVPWERIALDDLCWVDVARGWLAGADDLLDQMVATVPWGRGRQRMYDRVVDDPRLSWWPRAGEPWPDGVPGDVLEQMGAALSDRYDAPMRGPGCNFYRDGRDSVAPHRDRVMRDHDVDALVAVVTLGAVRPFPVHPFPSGPMVMDLRPGSGDVLVLGGRCQRRFTHGVPKVARSGPRVSLTWRWSEVGWEPPPRRDDPPA